jgi:hypothetical protein
VLLTSLERHCNPDYKWQTSFEPDSAHLKVTKSKTLIPGSESFEFITPSTSQSRAKKATPVPAKIVESIEIGDDEENVNKENYPAETQASINISLPPTQVSVNEEVLTSATELPDNISIPETFQSEMGEVEPPLPTVAKVASSRKRSAGSTATESSAKVRRSNTRSMSDSSHSSDLFNFTTSSGKVDARKRKVPESSEPKVQNERAKRSKIVDSDSDEEPLQPAPKPTTVSNRKRPAAGDLFAFNTNFVKKTKSSADDSQVSFRSASGIIPLQKSYVPTPIKPSTTSTYKDDDSGDSCDSGVWLSKKMITVNLNDSTDGIKTEPIVEHEQSMDAEDIKPQNLGCLFSVVANSSYNTSSSMISKRKQFVKKKNFKPQNSVVTMKVMRVEETHIPLDDF